MKICVYVSERNPACGGFVVLHKLCALLKEHGCDARAYMDAKETPCWFDRDCAAVYAEGVTGNPLGAKRVVRWLLNTPGVIGRVTTYDAGEIMVAYSPHFGLNNTSEILCVIDRCPDWIHLPRSADSPRSGTCFTVRKGRHKIGYHSMQPDARLVSGPPEVVGPLFRSHERFISYDSATFLNVQAALCGCLSIVIPDEHVTADEWRAGHPLMKYGIAYGFDKDEIDRAVATMPLVDSHLSSIESKTHRQIDRLLLRIGE